MPCSVCGVNPREVQAKCRPCYNDYMRNYMAARYERRRSAAIEQLGGVCVDCGATQNLEFDHADSSTKSFDIGKRLAGVAEDKLQTELKKIVLRCQRCHVEKSKKMDWGLVEHGSGLTGKRNCSCDKCRPLKNSYARRRKARRTASLGRPVR